MAKLPDHLRVEWDSKPTDMDNIGCDGLYIKSLEVRCPDCNRHILKMTEPHEINQYIWTSDN